MTKTPKASGKKIAAKAAEAAPNPVATNPMERAGIAIERALVDPLTSALKRAGLRRAQKSAGESAPAAAPAAPVSTGAGKPGLAISPLAVPFPVIPPIAGVEIATGRAGFYKHEREDLLLMRFAEGTSAAGVFTRHGVGSAPVDWCKRQLATSGGADVRALIQFNVR